MKYIYLDQNKWIELAKGIKENNPKYISLHEIIINRVREGIWAFPLSLIHIQETMKRKKETSRNEILDLMFSISNGYAICDYMTADTLEFNAWTMNKTVDCLRLQNAIIQHDWAALIGLSTQNTDIELNTSKLSLFEQFKVIETIKQMIRDHSCDREIFDLICNIANNEIYENEEFYYQSYKQGRDSFISWKNHIKQFDEYSDKHLYPTYLINTFFDVYKERLTNLSPYSQANMIQLFDENSKNKTAAIANIETLPGFNIYNRLVFELYNNQQKQVHPHDFNDLAYLRVAVPYCDIVVGENYWCDRVKHYKLDVKYQTEIRTKLLDLSTL